MQVRIMRHGDAPFIDGERQLSEQGIEEVKLMAEWLAKQAQPTKILVSPLLRAQQTYQHLARFIEQSVPQYDEKLLKPESDPKIAIEYFEALQEPSLLLVSHMPLVTNLLETWLPGKCCYFPTAAIAELEIRSDAIQLSQFKKPSDLL